MPLEPPRPPPSWSELHFQLLGWCKTAGSHLRGGEHFCSVLSMWASWPPLQRPGRGPGSRKDSGHEAGGTGSGCVIRGQRKDPGPWG